MSEPYWEPLAAVPSGVMPAPAGNEGKWLTVAGGAAVWQPLPTLPTRLGDFAETITDWNSARKNGWYMATPGTTNAPITSDWTLGEVVAHNDIWVTQRVWAFTLDSGSPVYERRYRNGNWYPWKVIGPPSFGTAFPTAPVDGEEYILTDNPANPAYNWRMRYNAASGSAYKWECVGGRAWRAIENVPVVMPANTWQTFGPAFVAPRAGEYHFTQATAWISGAWLIMHAAVWINTAISVQKLDLPGSGQQFAYGYHAIGAGQACYVGLHCNGGATSDYRMHEVIPARLA